MDNKQMEFKKLQMKLKIQHAWNAATEKVKGVAQEAWNNKEVLMVVVPAVVGGLATVTKVVGKTVNNHQEQRIKDTQFYDRSLGHYLYTRRPLSQSELREVSKRKRSGETYTEIFSSMGLNKR